MGKISQRQAAGSVLWSAIERFSVQGVQYLLSIIIARLLLPSDFGLIAMLGIFIAVAQTFIDGGFANALIQKKNRTEEDYSTVFYFNIVLSVVLYLLLYASAPWIASFYNEPQLEVITKVIGLTLIINSLGIVQQTRLTVALDFKRQALASLMAVILSGSIGVAMAYGGYGVWTLVWFTLLNYLLRVLLLWAFSRWMPLARFSMASFRELFSFGSKILLSSLLHTIYVNLYTLVIGKKFAAAELGYFNRASTLAQFPSTNLTNVIVRAVYPIQCRMQDDTEQLNRYFILYLRMACYIIFPVMIGMCVLASPLVEALLTVKWLPAVPLLQILCIAYMWDPVMKINHNMLNVKGRSDYFLRAELIKKAVAVLILVISIPFGIQAMCVGLVLYSFADMAIIARYTCRLTGIGLWRQIRELTPVLLLSISMGVVVHLATLPVSGVWMKLCLGSVAGVVYFVIASLVCRFGEFRQLLSFLPRRR